MTKSFKLRIGICRACRMEYDKPTIQPGTRHKTCTVSPAGRFDVVKREVRNRG
jgi:hypothetical protein